MNNQNGREVMLWDLKRLSRYPHSNWRNPFKFQGLNAIGLYHRTGSWIRGLVAQKQRNSYRPSFSRPVSSLQFTHSNGCNVLAGEQIFLEVRSSSILTSKGFFVSWDSLFSTHPRRQRAPGWAGPLEISAPRPAHCIHWRLGTEGWIPMTSAMSPLLRRYNIYFHWAQLAQQASK